MENQRKRGRLMMWCEHCTEEGGKNFFFLSTDENFNNHCPKCKRLLTKRMCVRCGYEWSPRNKSALAAVCPRCASPYWCRERLTKRDKE